MPGLYTPAVLGCADCHYLAAYVRNACGACSKCCLIGCGFHIEYVGVVNNQLCPSCKKIVLIGQQLRKEKKRKNPDMEKICGLKELLKIKRVERDRR